MPKLRFKIIAAFLLAALMFPVAGFAEDFIVSKGDVLKITVYENEDLATETLVGANGIVNLPLIGDVKVAGLSVRQAEKKIAERLAKGYIVNLHVTVMISESHGVIYVTGQVQKPGAYKVEPGTTVIKAIALAGGLTDKASPRRTKLTRKVKGKESTKKADMNEKVQPDDVIEVPESFF